MKIQPLWIIGMLLISTTIFAQDPDFHIYLCFGQSNMEGQGKIEAIDREINPRVKMMQAITCENLNREKGMWYPAVPPLAHCWSGLSPAAYFGRTLADNLSDSVTIGIINVSVGGADIRLFDKELYRDYINTYKESWFTDKIKFYEENPYQYLINLAKTAQKDGIIKGILVHQGETNTNDSRWPDYVKSVYENMLTDLGLDANSVPLLAGELVHSDQGGTCSSMNTIINTLPNTIPTAHVIASQGCEALPDNVHFSSAGARLLGIRYATKMLELLKDE